MGLGSWMAPRTWRAAAGGGGTRMRHLTLHPGIEAAYRTMQGRLTMP